jgi:hypothetical protein
MRRTTLIAALLALLGAGASTVAQGQSVRPALRAHLADCQTGPSPADRFAVFTGSMPTGPGVHAMAMRFDLFERQPGGGWTAVSLPRWGVWEKTAKAGVPGFIFAKRVEQLAAPAGFRATVSFRWLDAAGNVLRTARRTSRVCHQPDPRPDLHVKRVIFTASGAPKVVVVNRGLGDAGPFSISVTRQEFVATRTVDGLVSGAKRTLGFPVGRCTAGEPIQVVLDPSGQVDEAIESDDAITVDCPTR